MTDAGHGPAMPATQSRVPGHTLRSEGAPFVVNHRQQTVHARRDGGTGGYGRGLCSCGSLSDLVDSAAKRKAWHRDHKDKVAREADQTTAQEAPGG